MSLTRSDGTVTANWPAISNATKYHVTYTTDGGGSWHAPVADHRNVPTNSLTFNADNSKSYMVGVRAGNDQGWSGWRNSPQAGPYTPPAPTATPTPTPKPDPTATPTPQPEPTATPTGVSATGGDQTVTLAWHNPGDASVTGYQVQANHTATATGKLSGWSAWWDVPNGGAVATSYTLSNLTNGKEYRFKVRAVNAAGESKPGPRSAPWYVTAWPQKPPPPAVPSNVAATPGNGYLDISWDAVSDATGYDVKAKTAGSSTWHDVAGNISATSYRYNTSLTIDFVAVRARNSGGTSAWTELSRMPPDSLLPIATGLSSGRASAQSGGSIANKLDAPTWGTITRDLRRGAREGSGTINLNWTAVTNATGYNITCSNAGWYWHKCGWDNSGTVTYTSVPRGQSHPVKVSHFRRGSESPGTPGDYLLYNSRSYMVSIRAVNDEPTQASAWVTTPSLRPASPQLENFTVTRAAGQVTLSWTPNFWTTGYEIDCAAAVSGQPAAYTRCATLTDQVDTDAVHSVTITNWTAGGTNYSIDNTSIYDLQITSTNTWSRARWLPPLIHPIKTLGVSSVTATGATLTVYGHTGNWWYKGRQLSGSYGTCTQVTDSTSVTLSTLSALKQYRYHAYSATGCNDADFIATANFRTITAGSGPAIAVSNLTQTTARFTLSGHTGNWWYTNGARAAGEGSCTAGPSNFIVNLSALTNDTSYTFKAYSASTCASAAQLAVSHYRTTPGPALTASNVADTTATITLANHSGDWWHQGTERGATQTTCTKATGAAVDLTGLTAGKPYTWGAYSASTCAQATLLDSVNFTTLISLTSSSVTATGATLTIAGHSEAWYYNATTGPHTACQGPVSGTSTTLSGLTSGSTYTYTAYSDSACTTANELASAAAFTTP